MQHTLYDPDVLEKEMRPANVFVTLANGETTSLQVTPGGIMVTERVDVEPTSRWDNWSMTLVAKFAGRMVT